MRNPGFSEQVFEIIVGGGKRQSKEDIELMVIGGDPTVVYCPACLKGGGVIGERA